MYEMQLAGMRVVKHRLSMRRVKNLMKASLNKTSVSDVVKWGIGQRIV